VVYIVISHIVVWATGHPEIIPAAITLLLGFRGFDSFADEGSNLDGGSDGGGGQKRGGGDDNGREGAIYARVSTDKQAEEGHSIQAQIEKMKKKASTMGISVKHVIREERGIRNHI
jgi:hypothetical protein